MKGNSQYLKMIDLGSLKNLAQFAKCPIFSQKPIHPTGPDAMVHILQYVWLLGISGLKTRYILTGSVFLWQQIRLFLGQCIKPYHKSIAQKSRRYKTATGNKCWLYKRNLQYIQYIHPEPYESSSIIYSFVLVGHQSWRLTVSTFLMITVDRMYV